MNGRLLSDAELDALDGCELDKRHASTSWERLRELLGERCGEPGPDESEDEHGLRHKPR